MCSNSRTRALGAILLGLALAPTPARGLPLISEVFYDAAGSDDGKSFIELFGAPGSALDGFTLEGVNGANGAITTSLALSGSRKNGRHCRPKTVNTGGIYATLK